MGFDERPVAQFLSAYPQIPGFGFAVLAGLVLADACTPHLNRSLLLLKNRRHFSWFFRRPIL
jgi:hypothetical protein